MITNKKKLVDAIMAQAVNTGDRSPVEVWSIPAFGDFFGGSEKKSDLKKSVQKLIDWLDSVKDEKYEIRKTKINSL